MPNTSKSSPGATTGHESRLQQQVLLCRSMMIYADELAKSSYRSSYEHPRRTSRQAPARRISTRSSHEDTYEYHSCKDNTRMSPGPLSELLTRTCTRSCKGPWQDFTKIRAQGTQGNEKQQLDKNLMPGPSRALKRFPQDRHKRTCWCWSGSDKTEIQEPRQRRTSYRHFLCKDLF